MGDPPLGVYVPQSIEEVQQCVREAALLGGRVVPRGGAAYGGPHPGPAQASGDRVRVLLTHGLAHVLAIDEPSLTVTALSGVRLAELENLLAARGLGLPVVPKPSDGTLGGFCSVAGVSAASHRHGLFVDTVLRIQYVDRDGNVGWCGRSEDPEVFDRLRAGLGRFGVIVALTVKVVRADKRTTILKRQQARFRTLEAFLAGTAGRLADPGGALYQRGIFTESMRWNGKPSGFGRFFAYHAIPQTRPARVRGTTGDALLRALNGDAGALHWRPRGLRNRLALWTPAYPSIRSVERTDGWGVGSARSAPTRAFAVFAPMGRYQELLGGSFRLMRDFRERYRCFSSVSVAVRGVTSTYLAQGRRARAYCQLAYGCQAGPERLTDGILEELTERLDDLTLEHGGFRSMESRTAGDPGPRPELDPNTFYARNGPAGGGREERAPGTEDFESATLGSPPPY